MDLETPKGGSQVVIDNASYYWHQPLHENFRLRKKYCVFSPSFCAICEGFSGE